MRWRRRACTGTVTTRIQAAQWGVGSWDMPLATSLPEARRSGLYSPPGPVPSVSCHNLGRYALVKGISRGTLASDSRGSNVSVLKRSLASRPQHPPQQRPPPGPAGSPEQPPLIWGQLLQVLTSLFTGQVLPLPLQLDTKLKRSPFCLSHYLPGSTLCHPHHKP